MELLWRVCSAGIQFCSGFVFANKVRMYRCLHNVRAHAYSNILSEVPLRQTEDGQYRPKHVAVHYIVIKYTSCDTDLFHYITFSKFRTHKTSMTHFLDRGLSFFLAEGYRSDILSLRVQFVTILLLHCVLFAAVCVWFT